MIKMYISAGYGALCVDSSAYAFVINTTLWDWGGPRSVVTNE